IVDNFSNSSEAVPERIARITGSMPRTYHADLLDGAGLGDIFDREDVEAVVHLAGLKAVGESVAKPLEYYHNNMTGTFHLCDAMRRHGVKLLVFSSSATVYGTPERVPI